MRRVAIMDLSPKTIEALKAEPKNTLYKEVLEMNGNKVYIELVPKSNEFSIEMANFYTYEGALETSLPIECFKNVEKTPNTGHSGLKKEFCGTRAQLYRNDYGKMISKVNEFSKIIKKDFPTIKDEDIEIVIFDGRSKKHVMGVRFNIPEGSEIPKDYFEWSEFYNMDQIA